MQLLSQVQASLVSLAWDSLRLCAWLILLMVIFVPLEKFFALHTQKVFRKSFGADLLFYFVSSLLPKLILILPLTFIAKATHDFLPASFYESIASWPLLIRALAGLVVGEIGAYWGHRWSHENQFLWRFHSIHHDAEELDWLVHTRAHPVDMVFTRLCALVPMYLLGLAQPMADRVDLVPVLVTIAATMWGFFIHSNISWRLGWLEGLISSPAFHHWHHTNDGPEVVNKNYSTMLPWLDKCFGTYYLPQSWPGKYGINAPEPPVDSLGAITDSATPLA